MSYYPQRRRARMWSSETAHCSQFSTTVSGHPGKSNLESARPRTHRSLNKDAPVSVFSVFSRASTFGLRSSPNREFGAICKPARSRLSVSRLTETDMLRSSGPSICAGLTRKSTCKLLSSSVSSPLETSIVSSTSSGIEFRSKVFLLAINAIKPVQV
jgi:hypothetical protein